MSEENLRPRWSVTIAHSALLDSICREIDDYLSYYAEVIETVGGEPSGNSRLEERRTVITLLLASYTEAVINMYCAFGFAPDQLRVIDRMPVVDKWTTAPSFRVKSYVFDKSGELYADLRSLVKCRDAIVHMRPQYSVDDELVHSGNAAALEKISHESVMKWIMLPGKLVDLIKAQDKSFAGDTLQSISDVWELSQDWQTRLAFYRDRLRKKKEEKAALAVATFPPTLGRC